MYNYTINLKYKTIKNEFKSDLVYREELFKFNNVGNLDDMINKINHLYSEIKDNVNINNIITPIKNKFNIDNDISAFYMCFSYDLFDSFYDLLCYVNKVNNDIDYSHKEYNMSKIIEKINNL